MSNSIMEAMAAGVPVVASDIPPNRELVVDGQTGFLVKVGDSVGMAQFTDRILADPALAQRLGESGRERMRTNFSVERWSRGTPSFIARCSPKDSRHVRNSRRRLDQRRRTGGGRRRLADDRRLVAPRTGRQRDLPLGRRPALVAARSAGARGRTRATRPAGPGAALGHRRLSIIDLGTGQQPLSNEDQTVWITFNGEIYNYQELRPDLEARGHRFQTHSDTETIVHLYEEYGPDCVTHLRGMFAFAIWDDRKKRLFLARDRIGKKPLFYRLESDRLLFGSELKALLQFPGRRASSIRPPSICISPISTCRIRTASSTGTTSSPRALGRVRRGRLQIRRYWAPPFSEGPRADGSNGRPTATSGWTPERWKTELRSTLTEAVRLRMRSDVPLGAFLSGGIDSTIVSGLMQQVSSQPIHTFSIGFPGQAVRRNVVRPGSGGLPGDAAPRTDRRAARPVDPAQADLALRRALLRQFGHPDDVPLGDDAARSHGGPLRRRRR